MNFLKCENVLYNVQFLLCSHQLTNSERQKIVRKHKSSGHKRRILEKCRHSHANLEPVEQKQYLEKRRKNYKFMDPKKRKFISIPKLKATNLWMI